MVRGLNHVAGVTRDLDRLGDFYQDTLGITMTAPIVERGLRHAFLPLDERTALHVFERPDADLDAAGTTIFERGRLDHFALAADDEAELLELRDRLVAAGASDGRVTDFGDILSVHFCDPDGTHLEVACFKTGRSFSTMPGR